MARSSRPRARTARARLRGVTSVELAVALAIGGSLLAVAIPAFLRALNASRFVEATDGIGRLGAAAVAVLERGESLPASAPLTPPTPPPGVKALDPPGLWDGPTWRALGSFRAAPEGVPHAFSFAFDRASDRRFVARARGDLDGDAVLSTFEVSGGLDEAGHAALDPGMFIAAEIE